MAFIFTMVANPLQFNFKRDGLDVAVRKTKFWVIDNPLAGWLKYQKNLNSDEPPEDFVLEDMRETVHATYAKTMKTLNSFFKWVDERKVQPVKEINDLYNMSNKIEASISDVLARITQTEAQKTELIKLQNEIDTQKQVSTCRSVSSNTILTTLNSTRSRKSTRTTRPLSTSLSTSTRVREKSTILFAAPPNATAIATRIAASHSPWIATSSDGIAMLFIGSASARTADTSATNVAIPRNSTSIIETSG